MTTVPLHLISPERMARALSSLTKEERQELLVIGINSMAEVMRDSRDVHLRRQAYEVLMMLLPADLKPAIWDTTKWGRH